MKLSTVLGAVVCMLSLGVVCTFALCMVEDVGEENISSYEYYSGENTDELLAEAETEQIVQETAISYIPPVFTETANYEDERDIMPRIADDNADITAETEESSPNTEENDETEISAPPQYSSISNEERYPVEYDVEEYGSGSNEVEEQSLYGVDNFTDNTLNSAEDEINYTDNESDDYTAVTEMIPDPSEQNDTAPEGVPVTPDDIVSFYSDTGSDAPAETVPPVQETSVSVSVQNSGGDTNETFTANFNGAVQTVNAYDLVCWIVNNEISSSFSDEAIKAQAVAAYSYVKYHNVNGLTPSVLVKKDPPQRIKDLVSSVWGVCCYYNGSVAQTVYMASSSGYTADAKNVWGGSFPYLKSVACPFDATSDPNYGSTKTVSEADMRSYLENSLGITLSNDPTNWIRITGYVDGNYVSSIDIDGQTTISGRKMRETVFNYKLKSAAFDVYYSNGTFTFTTYGYGHGVGMSQNGANILAKQGYSYVDILKYYFTGIEVL